MYAQDAKRECFETNESYQLPLNVETIAKKIQFTKLQPYILCQFVVNQSIIRYICGLTTNVTTTMTTTSATNNVPLTRHLMFSSVSTLA